MSGLPIAGELIVSADYDFSLINPVKITRLDKKGRVADEIQAVRQSGCGALSPLDESPQSSWARWAKTHYDDHDNLTFQRVYFSIPEFGEGLRGIHYNQSDYDGGSDGGDGSNPSFYRTVSFIQNTLFAIITCALPFVYVVWRGRFWRGVFLSWLGSAILLYLWSCFGVYLVRHVDHQLSSYLFDGQHFVAQLFLGCSPSRLGAAPQGPVVHGQRECPAHAGA